MIFFQNNIHYSEGIPITDRQEKIMEILKEKKQISITALSNLLHFSESTIRRDLITLEKENLLRRTPGGATFVNNNYIENSTKIKAHVSSDEKKYIASLAVDFITDFQTIFLDSSSTSFTLAKLLTDRKNLTVFTTNIETALLLGSNPHINTYIIGGLVKNDIVQGAYPIDLLNNIHADIAFLSCKAFDINYGCYEVIESEAIIKNKMHENSNQSILLIDNTKFNQRATYKSLELDSFDYLITNDINENEMREIESNSHIDVIF